MNTCLRLNLQADTQRPHFSTYSCRVFLIADCKQAFALIDVFFAQYLLTNSGYDIDKIPFQTRN